MTDVPDSIAHFRELHRFIEASFSDGNQLQSLFAYLADRIGSGTVAIIAAVASSDVDLYDVALFKYDLVRGYSVYDFVVYGYAGASGEAAVSEERRLSAAFFNEALYFGVDLLCADARSYNSPPLLPVWLLPVYIAPLPIL